MNTKVLIAGALVVVPLVAVLAMGFQHDPRAIDSPLIDKPAPAFALATVDATGTVALESLRGKPVVVNFWATWCEPCKAEHPALQALARAWSGRASFVGVVYQDTPDKIVAWLGRMGSAYPTVVDTGSTVAMAWGVYGVPETYVLDSSGVIRHKITGPVDPAALDAQLRDLAAKGERP
jgi:cytochrome c biogenesis protein CcmG/thiol:disulfide interchange protein DsbE